jgi:DNA-binding NtrC family response regulator
MHILVVDDDIVQLNTLRRGLKTKGHQVLEALTVEDALKNLNDADTPRIDLVLTDYVMPVRDGIDLLKTIRKNDSFLPVIIMTAHGDDDVFIDAFRNHCNGFIIKPFTSIQLIEEINRVMQETTSKLDGGFSAC